MELIETCFLASIDIDHKSVTLGGNIEHFTTNDVSEVTHENVACQCRLKRHQPCLATYARVWPLPVTSQCRSGFSAYMENTVCKWQCSVVREFRNPCGNCENVDLMMWAKTQDR